MTVPGLAFAALHTVLIGPHYMAQLHMGILEHLRTYGITIMTLLVLLMRRRIFWSVFGLKKMVK